MDHYQSHNPRSSYHQHQSAHKRERNDNWSSPCVEKLSRPHHYRHSSEPAVGQIPATSHSLSTRREYFEKDFPLYKQPVEIGCFSLDSERRFYNDNRQMRYYVEPDRNPNFDLRDGYRERYRKRDDSVKEKLDHLLHWIVANKSKLRSSATSTSLLNADFVTWRGHLTKLLTTPYETREGWLLAVTRFRDTVYISEVETEAARREQENRTPRHEEMMYWGYKFEQYTCADKPDGLPDPKGVVNTNEAFCTVVQTRLADHKLLFSGEVDCRDKDPKASPPPSCYVEMKTSAEICTPKQRSNFHRFKLLKWWAQSFLPGVPRVVAGFRDDEGVVVSVETFHVSKISSLIRNEHNCWKPTVCMNFCCDFLTFVKHVAVEDDPDVVYLFQWDPRRDVTYTIHRKSQYSFLPPWYIKEMTSDGELDQH